MPAAVSIVIPAYNEAPSIERVVRQACAAPFEHEILVVEDGSTDATGEILFRLERELPIAVIRHPRNLGKGRAIRSALERCRGDLIVIQDADLEYDRLGS